MKILTLVMSIFFLSSICFGQASNQKKEENIIGVFSSHKEERVIGQQIAQAGVTGSKYETNQTFLTIGEKKFQLFKYSEKQISDFEINNPNVQQEQKPFFVTLGDYYIKENLQEDGSYCLFTGTINNEKQIIYNASFIKVFNENEIVKALMLYWRGQKKKEKR